MHTYIYIHMYIYIYVIMYTHVYSPPPLDGINGSHKITLLVNPGTSPKGWVAGVAPKQQGTQCVPFKYHPTNRPKWPQNNDTKTPAPKQRGKQGRLWAKTKTTKPPALQPFKPWGNIYIYIYIYTYINIATTVYTSCKLGPCHLFHRRTPELRQTSTQTPPIQLDPSETSTRCR